MSNQESHNPKAEALRVLASRGVAPSDVSESFSRSSGPGGQHVNKVSTAVTLQCRKLDVAVTVEDSRSQSRNRQIAWQRLLQEVRRREEALRAQRKAAREKKRRATRKRPRGVKERILKSKKKRSQIKKLRVRVDHRSD